MENITTILVTTILIQIILFIIIRKIILWYFRINERIKLAENQITLMRKNNDLLRELNDKFKIDGLDSELQEI
jgi:hypothetical protein